MPTTDVDPRPAPPIDYESKAGASGPPAQVEGATLWVPINGRLPPICVRCGRQDDLIEQTHQLLNGESFVYFLCGLDVADGNRQGWGVLIAFTVLNVASLAAAIFARYAAAASQGAIFLGLMVIWALQVGYVLIASTSGPFTVSRYSRRAGYLELTGVAPVLLPYLGDAKGATPERGGGGGA